MQKQVESRLLEVPLTISIKIMERTLFVFLLVLLSVLCSPMLYAQEAVGWDAHEISKMLGGAAVIILIAVLVWNHLQNKKNKP